MKKSIILLLLLSGFVHTVCAQVEENYSDNLLSSSFKLFQAADFDMANHMLPFIRKRFEKELKNPDSFTNKYDSLSKYIKIHYAADGLLKTYTWGERSGSCCYSSATFAQFKTQSGKINYIDLENPEARGPQVFITNLHPIEINNNTFYLLLGWGSCCGGKHYATARIYQIADETLVQATAQFNEEDDLLIGANRDQEINLKYNPDTKILSYNKYKFYNSMGFYAKEKTVVQWKLKKDGFKKMK